MIGIIAAFIKSLGVKDGVIGVLFVTLVITAAQWHKTSLDAKNIKTVYMHPEVKTVEKIVYKTGPVRIKTVIVKEKGGDEVTTIEEEHAPEITTSETTDEKKPVPIDVVMTPTRTDRYLVSVGLNRLTPDFDGKALFVGYGFKNRMDVQVGAVEHDGFSPWVLTTFRF